MTVTGKLSDPEGGTRVSQKLVFAEFQLGLLLYTSFPGAQRVKSLPEMLETWVSSLGWEDPLQKGTAIHSRILAWRIPWTEEPGRLQSMRSQRVGHN